MIDNFIITYSDAGRRV